MKQHDADMKALTINLGFLFDKQDLFIDNDGDGYPDTTNLVLAVVPDMQSGALWAGIINLAARFNITSSGNKISCPCVLSEPEAGTLLIQSPTVHYDAAACLESDHNGGWVLSGHCELSMKRVLDILAIEDICSPEEPIQRVVIPGESSPSGFVYLQSGIVIDVILPPPPAELAIESVKLDKNVDLTSLGTTFLATDLHSPRATRCTLGLVLPSQVSSLCGQALFSIASTLTSQATEILLPFAQVANNPNAEFCLTVIENQDKEAWFHGSNNQFTAVGGTQPLVKLLKELERLWFESDILGGDSLETWKTRVAAAAMIVQGEGQEGYLAHELVQGRLLPPQDRLSWNRISNACRRLGLSVPEQQVKSLPITRKMKLAGEWKRLLTAATNIPVGQGQIFCRAYLGANKQKRFQLQAKLHALLQQKGYDPQVVVLRTHKPAVSWLLEEVEPALPKMVHSLRISFRPFSMPNQMESSTRWAQEIYPAPDVVCQRRGWSTDRIHMVMDTTQNHAYLVQALNCDGELLSECGLTPLFSRIDYTLELRSDQQCYPTTAGIQLKQDKKIFWHCQIPTDRELFWGRFQEKWLPEITALMNDALPTLLERNALAFWEEIRFEIAIDEEQEQLGLGEERIAPMEALHEDVYFGLLAFMQAFRDKYCPETNIQLGRIVPFVRPVDGKQPWAKLLLKPYKHRISCAESMPQIGNIGFEQGYLLVEFPGDQHSINIEERERLCEVAKAWGYNLNPTENGFLFKARPAKNNNKQEVAGNLSVPDATAIPSGEQIRTWTKSLSSRPGIRVIKAGKSLMGRDILAVEATGDNGMAASRARLLKPTLFINARHHANEVSGSNAAMCLLHELASGAATSEMLMRSNVVVVPLENADGVATLEEMLPYATDHKLHAARYNALGMEWYDQYFDPDTPFSEARVKARLFERWLPEYMLDLHGVPSHEWEQPFAGYISPRFKEHWIPRSFVYAILPFYDQPDHPGSDEAKQLAATMSAAMEKEQDIVQLNQEIFNRYERYAKAFEPEVFTSDLERSLVVVPTCERISKTNYAHRKWPLVKSEVITEVLDEVARGPWLEQCTRAHLVIIKTMLTRMCNSRQKAELVREEQPGGVLFSWRRQENG